MLPIKSLNTGLADAKKYVSLCIFLNFYLLILFKRKLISVHDSPDFIEDILRGIPFV